MTGKVTKILIGDVAGSELLSVPQANLEAGKGIVGDRYYSENGTFSEQLEGLPDFEITLIEQEEIDSFNTVTNQNLPPKAFRRNVVTTGVRLNDLVGQEFQVGSLTLKGIRLCEPCAYLAKLLGDDIMKHMIHKAGLRAQIVTSGSITVDDDIH